jgi:unsaturated rhamnogalacturonyl hydrolase
VFYDFERILAAAPLLRATFLPLRPATHWLETSSSSIYVYTISKAAERGYIPKSFSAIACKGYQGVLSQLSLDADGEAHIANICEETNVGNLDYYLQRAKDG